MEPQLEDVEESSSFDEAVIEYIIDNVYPEDITWSTEELNDILRAETGSNILIPVFSNNVYEDIARLLTEMDSDELLAWTYQWFDTDRGFDGHFHGNAHETRTVMYKAVVGIFCQTRITYLGRHFIRFLKKRGYLFRHQIYPYLVDVAIKACNTSFADFYTTLEGFGLFDVLVQDMNYPPERRAHAAALSAMSYCSEIEGGSKSSTSLPITILAIVYAKRMYKDVKELVDKIIAARYDEDVTALITDILEYVVDETDKKDELLVYTKDSIVLALRILEELYGIDVIEIVSKSAKESVRRGADLLFGDNQ